ncbi:MFS transporter [Streptomyces sp. NPDC046931]|uniref:MFS transporter n=1 Tax=Streptomyces sp. NPDC046931 TaxID=3154806 RepID=UPI0033D2EDC5
MRWHPVWSDSGFRALWAASGVSLIGTQVSVLALPLTALIALHASAFEAALLTAAGTAPFLLLGLPAGAWADRWPRRTLMVACDLGRAVLLASLPAAQMAGALTLAQLYLVALGVGVLSVFFDIASLSVLPSLVDGDRIAPANARLETVRAAAQTSGPAIGGTLVQLLTAPFALALDALSYLASALLLRGLPPLPAPAAPKRAAGTLTQIGEGIRFCLNHPYIRPLAIGAAWLNFWTEALLAVFLTYAVRELHLSAARVGTVLALAVSATSPVRSWHRASTHEWESGPLSSSARPSTAASCWSPARRAQAPPPGSCSASPSPPQASASGTSTPSASARLRLPTASSPG